jgi:mono/diheme cytochrome c family protein
MNALREQMSSSILLGSLLAAALLIALCADVLITVRAREKDRSTSTTVKNDAEAREAFLEAYKVFMHPRCVNCHPAGDAPLQGEDSRPHSFFRLRRGADGQGVFAVKCINCHQAQNQSGPHMPPGATYPLKDGLEDQAHRGEPRWRMPTATAPMVFEKRTPRQLCKQLLDKKQNGGLTPGQLIEHVDHDPLVLWGWNPGEGRSAPGLSHTEFVQNVKEWINKGGACPK